MARPVFLDDDLERRLRRDGSVVVPLLAAAEAANLLAEFQALTPDDGFRPTGEGINRARYHCTFLDANVAYKAATADIVQREFQPRIDHVLDRYNILTGNLYVKPPGLGRFEIHQNWPTVPDIRDTTVTVWCPLVDVGPGNGTIQIVPRSHKILPDLAAVTAPKYFERFYDALIDHWLQPVTLRAGECLVFDDSMLHWSDDNLSSADRWVLQIEVVPEELPTVVYYFDAEPDPPRFEMFAVDSSFYVDHEIGVLLERPEGLPSLGYVERSNLDIDEVQFADLMADGRRCRERVYAGEPVESAFPVPAAAPPERAEAGRFFTSLGRWLDVQATDLSQYPRAIEQIYDGTIDGMTIRGVLDPAEMARAVDRSEEFRSEFKDHGEQVIYGTPLVGADDDRSDYFTNAGTMLDGLPKLFDVDFVGRIGSVLSTLAGGRAAAVPSEGPGRSYVPATCRYLPPGRGVMHAHTANEFCNVWKAYDHLRATAKMWNSLSYFVVAQQADEGGELVLYDLCWDDTPDDIAQLGMSGERDALLSRYVQRRISPEPGDMILFTGGRIWHRVAPVTGATTRVTVGGFVALSLDDQRVYFWS